MKNKIKKKPMTIAKMKKVVWALYSQMIRMRDCLRTTGCTSWGFCISCGKRYHIKLLQAGHFLPGRHNANLFYERGTHCQCYNCNINLKGNTLAYMDAIKKLYGEGIVEELRANEKKFLQFDMEYLEGLKEKYKAEIKRLEKEGLQGSKTELPTPQRREL